MSVPEVITFDCYGTLIDWEKGIRTAFRQAMEETGSLSGLAARALELYPGEEAKVEAETPYQSYREVLSKTALAVAEKIGWDLRESRASFLADDLPSWKPFPDTNPALERLAKKYSLGILSNTDNDLLAGTLKHLQVKFDIIVTAENVRSYKPKPGHFEEARRLVGPRTWLHVASSQFHDIEPADKFGIKTSWVNRKHLHSEYEYKQGSVREVSDLLHLAEMLHC